MFAARVIRLVLVHDPLCDVVGYAKTVRFASQAKARIMCPNDRGIFFFCFRLAIAGFRLKKLVATNPAAASST
jgi:hypothetical protein